MAQVPDHISEQIDKVFCRLKSLNNIRKVVGILATNNVANDQLYISSVRQNTHCAYIGFVTKDLDLSRKIAQKFDGYIDLFALDIEPKTMPSDIFTHTKDIIKKSNIVPFRPTHITCNGIESFIQIIISAHNIRSIAVVGIGAIGSELVRRFSAHPGYNVVPVTRDIDTKEKLYPDIRCLTYKDFLSSPDQVDCMIACSSQPNTLDEKLLSQIKYGGHVIDVGGGCLTQEALTSAQTNNVTAISFNIGPAMLGYWQTYFDYADSLKTMPYREQRGYRLVSIGYLGRKGDILVDDAQAPKVIIGLCDGIGGVHPTDMKVESLYDETLF